MGSAKEQMIHLIQELPDDSSFDEILRELAFSRMVERGLIDSENGRTISNDEMGRRMDVLRRLEKLTVEGMTDEEAAALIQEWRKK